MDIECTLNRLEGEWWFDFGISYQRTEYHHKHKRVITIALLLVSLYIRW